MYTVPLAVVKVIDMMAGEIEYKSIWFENIQDGTITLPRSVIALFMIIFFVLMMPIILMNLTVTILNIKITSSEIPMIQILTAAIKINNVLY